jgi:hypothetical protein
MADNEINDQEAEDFHVIPDMPGEIDAVGAVSCR